MFLGVVNIAIELNPRYKQFSRPKKVPAKRKLFDCYSKHRSPQWSYKQYKSFYGILLWPLITSVGDGDNIYVTIAMSIRSANKNKYVTSIQSRNHQNIHDIITEIQIRNRGGYVVWD